MTVAFSTSGPRASVALLREGEILYAGDEEARGRAGEACLSLLRDGLAVVGASLADASLFAADLGPGSFTGIRVGIVLAKTLAWERGVSCAAADAFDLVDPAGIVALPSRKGEWFVRIPGLPPERTREAPEVVGVPLASGFARLALTPVSPFALVPAYLLEPSISMPNKPFRRPDAAWD